DQIINTAVVMIQALIRRRFDHSPLPSAIPSLSPWNRSALSHRFWFSSRGAERALGRDWPSIAAVDSSAILSSDLIARPLHPRSAPEARAARSLVLRLLHHPRRNASRDRGNPMCGRSRSNQPRSPNGCRLRSELAVSRTVPFEPPAVHCLV